MPRPPQLAQATIGAAQKRAANRRRGKCRVVIMERASDVSDVSDVCSRLPPHARVYER